MLLTAAAVWGTGYTFAKIAINAMSVQWVMTIRMLAGTLLMTVVMWPKLRNSHILTLFIPGLLLSLSYWLAFLLQMIGLKTIGPGRNAFLTATYCVIVPFLVWIGTRRRPAIRHILAAIICLFGVGLVSITGSNFGNGGISQGDLLTLCSSVMYALNLVLCGFFAKKQLDMLVLTYCEFAFSGLLFLGGALIFDPVPSPQTFTPGIVGSLLYLIIGSTLLAQTLQNIAFTKVPATQASLILSTESLFSVLTSVIVLHELLTASDIAGFILIFAAIVLSEVHVPRRSGKFRRNATGPRVNVLH